MNHFYWVTLFLVSITGHFCWKNFIESEKCFSSCGFLTLRAFLASSSCEFTLAWKTPKNLRLSRRLVSCDKIRRRPPYKCLGEEHNTITILSFTTLTLKPFQLRQLKIMAICVYLNCFNFISKFRKGESRQDIWFCFWEPDESWWDYHLW